jgi:hypothetical protein
MLSLKGTKSPPTEVQGVMTGSAYLPGESVISRPMHKCPVVVTVSRPSSFVADVQGESLVGLATHPG